MTTAKPRCLGLDIGDKRIGIAISDPHGLTAAGLETLKRQDLQTDIEKVADVARRHHVVEIIIGMPSNVDVPEAEGAMHVIAFGKKLAQATGLPIIYEDERLSSVSAIRTLTIQTDEWAAPKVELVGMQAAAIILQKHLDRKEPPPSA